MLFSIAPKKSKCDLFNRESEYSKLEKDVQTGRIILLDGLRRIGKTSLLKVFLNESDHFSIMIDCRAFENNYRINKQAFNKAISEKINKQTKASKFKKLLLNFSEFGVGEITITYPRGRFFWRMYMTLINWALQPFLTDNTQESRHR